MFGVKGDRGLGGKASSEGTTGEVRMDCCAAITGAAERFAKGSSSSRKSGGGESLAEVTCGVSRGKIG